MAEWRKRLVTNGMADIFERGSSSQGFEHRETLGHQDYEHVSSTPLSDTKQFHCSRQSTTSHYLATIVTTTTIDPAVKQLWILGPPCPAVLGIRHRDERVGLRQI